MNKLVLSAIAAILVSVGVYSHVYSVAMASGASRSQEAAIAFVMVAAGITIFIAIFAAVITTFGGTVNTAATAMVATTTTTFIASYTAFMTTVIATATSPISTVSIVMITTTVIIIFTAMVACSDIAFKELGLKKRWVLSLITVEGYTIYSALIVTSLSVSMGIAISGCVLIALIGHFGREHAPIASAT